MSKTIQDLRDVLFGQLEKLIDPSQEVDLKRHEMVNNYAQTIVNSAKAEIEYAKVIKGAVTIPFIEEQQGCEERPYMAPPAALPAPGEPVPLPPAETQKALGFGGRKSSTGPDHYWRKDAARERQRREDRAA
ncbi:hypothetical protein [Tardiphaga sp. 862_B3_N1_1]|uniref:hypothetical protein n=1 Tax=Tardiphaga sp. 862_B3_N1_1 TaxID=3240763 RepID=UPI003F8AA9D0